MKARLVLLASSFILTPFFLMTLILYQTFLYHQNSHNTNRFLGIFAKAVSYQAIPETLASTNVVLSVHEARVDVLREFFLRYKTPLLVYAQDIVDAADRYGLDYRLLPAIAMQESSGAKKVIQDSHNPFGFGIYGSKVIRFDSWEEGIEIVGQALKEEYADEGLKTPEQIMVKYTPPSLSKGGAWAKGVYSFMSELQ